MLRHYMEEQCEEICVQPLDEELAAKWKAGDISAFEALFRRYDRRVFNVAARVIGSRDDAEDIKQETFIRAHKSIKGFRGGKFSTWLFKIAVNLCIDRARRRQPEMSSIDDADWKWADTQAIDPEHALLQEEFSRVVRTVFGSIPAHYRILLVLRHIDGMPYEEIAKVIGCSVNALGVRLHRAREIFKERMMPFLDENGRSVQDEMQRSETFDISAL